MLSSLVDEFEKVMGAGTNAQKKDLLHRVVKKFLIWDRPNGLQNQRRR